MGSRAYAADDGIPCAAVGEIACMNDWPFLPPIIPMEAEVTDELPTPPDWAYEPKWDGFRAIIWSRSARTGSGPRLDSRNTKPLLRYFPELEPAIAELPHGTVLDGEIVVILNGRLSFDALLNRIHPAKARITRLSRETPARLALFDVLALRGEDLRRRPFFERRANLEALVSELTEPARHAREGAESSEESSREPLTIAESSPWLLSPSTTDVEIARRWFREFEPAGFDGIVAKALDGPYAEGRREMIKVKHRRTVDCVIGGYRLHKDGRRVGSILLGLYNAQGELHFIGHCSSFSNSEAASLLKALRDIELRPDTRKPGESSVGFGAHSRHPGSASRWSGDKDRDFVPVSPVLVVEISYDQLTGDRFRHATRFERWRPDKDPRDCTMDQIERPRGPTLAEALNQAGNKRLRR